MSDTTTAGRTSVLLANYENDFYAGAKPGDTWLTGDPAVEVEHRANGFLVQARDLYDGDDFRTKRHYLASVRVPFAFVDDHGVVHEEVAHECTYAWTASGANRWAKRTVSRLRKLYA